MTLKAGVIGVGHLGKFHAQKYILNKKTKLIGIHDIDFQRGKFLAKELNTIFFESVDELLRSVDLVSISSPATKHYESTLKAINNGVHALVEKPFSHSLKEAEDLVKQAKEKDVYIQVGFIERFNIVFKEVLKYIDEPIFIESKREASFTGRSTDIDIVKDLMIHDIDLLLKIFGKDVLTIEAEGTRLLTDSIDVASARVGYKNGRVANLTASRVSNLTERSMTIYQKNNYLKIDFQSPFLEIFRNNNGRIESEKLSFTKNDSLYDELDYFIDVVGKRVDSEINVEDALISINLTDTISKKIYDRLNLL